MKTSYCLLEKKSLLKKIEECYHLLQFIFQKRFRNLEISLYSFNFNGDRVHQKSNYMNQFKSNWHEFFARGHNKNPSCIVLTISYPSNEKYYDMFRVSLDHATSNCLFLWVHLVKVRLISRINKFNASKNSLLKFPAYLPRPHLHHSDLEENAAPPKNKLLISLCSSVRSWLLDCISF